MEWTNLIDEVQTMRLASQRVNATSGLLEHILDLKRAMTSNRRTRYGTDVEFGGPVIRHISTIKAWDLCAVRPIFASMMSLVPGSGKGTVLATVVNGWLVVEMGIPCVLPQIPY